MGMVLGLTRLRDETIERILADPPLVWTVIAPDDPEAYERSRDDADRARKPGFFARLFGASTPSTPEPPRVVAPLTLAHGEGADVDLDKSWHGIHYVLTESADSGKAPLDFLLEGGRDVGDEDLGYGAGRVFTSGEVKEIAVAVNAITDDTLRARFDARVMSKARVYPEHLWIKSESSDAPLEYVMEYVKVLRGVLGDAVEKNHGLLITLS